MSQPLWSNLECLHLVEKELAYTGRNINKDLSQHFPGKSPNDIANRRRTMPHKALLERVKADMAEAAPDEDIQQTPQGAAAPCADIFGSPVPGPSNRSFGTEEVFISSPNSSNGSPRVTTPSAGPKILFDCEECGKTFKSRAYLSKHRRRGCVRNNVCPYCSTEFGTFSGMRLHVKKVHPNEYYEELESLKSKPASSEIYENLAMAEALAPPDTDMVLHLIATTGLSVDAIKYRRKQEVYKTHLAKARKSLHKQPSLSSHTNPGLAINSVSDQTSNIGTFSTTPTDIPTTELTSSSPILPTVFNSIDVISVSENGPSTPLASQRSEDYHLDSSISNSLDAPVIEVHEVSVYFDNDGGPRDTAISDNNSTDSKSVSSDHDIVVVDPDEIVTMSPSDDSAPRVLVETFIHDAAEDISRSPLIDDISIENNGNEASYVHEEGSEANTSMTALFIELQHQKESLKQSLARDNPLIASVDHLLSNRVEASNNSFEEWLSFRFRNIRPRRNSLRTSTAAGRTAQPVTSMSRNARRQAHYKKSQDLFSKNRRLLADIILSDRPLEGPGVDPPVREFEQIFRSTIENPSEPDDEHVIPVVLSDESVQRLNSLMVEKDIQKAKMGWSSSSPGSDGITVPMVKAVGNAELALAFNILLLSTYHPQPWKTLRTVMVPKKGSLRDPNNWRPITIGSTIQRLFHRALNHKLSSSLRLHMAQRGFVRTDGTLANSILLDHFIHSRTEKRKPYYVASLDLSRAFDNLSHSSILRAMNRFQLPQYLRRYIMSTYDASTVLRQNGYTSEPIKICRGVRQGDPLSPFIFNLVLDELLSSADEFPHCTARNLLIPPVLAFADDLVVMSDSKPIGQDILDRTSAFLGRRGLFLNANKCHALGVDIVRGAPLPSRTSVFTISGYPIPPVTGLNSFSYLGHEFSHSGILRPNIANLHSWLDNLQRSLLKPDQKMMILRYNVIPRMMHGLQNPKLAINILKEADKMVRVFIKRCLHLHVHTQDTLIHGRYRDGGLGVLSLVDVIPRTFSKRLENLASSEDEVISHALNSARLSTLRDRFARLATVPRPGSFISQQPFSKGLEQCAQDSSSNAWLASKPCGWSGRDYVRAVHLRAANLPTVGIPSNPPAARRCRSGCAADETICHILQSCPSIQDARISRHNYVVGKLVSHCRAKGFPVEIEPHVRVIAPDRGLDKPDLVIHVSQTTSVVCDVQISWDSNNLRDAWLHKRDRYGNEAFIAAAGAKWPGRSFIFSPLVLGARGVWPSCNQTTEHWLKIPQAFKRSCIAGVVKWGGTLHNIFMRSIRDRNPQRYRRHK